MKRQLISARLATLAVVLLALAVSARASVEETGDTYVVAKQDEPIEVEDETFSIPNFWGFGQVANEVSSELVEIMQQAQGAWNCFRNGVYRRLAGLYPEQAQRAAEERQRQYRQFTEGYGIIRPGIVRSLP